MSSYTLLCLVEFFKKFTAFLKIYDPVVLDTGLIYYDLFQAHAVGWIPDPALVTRSKAEKSKKYLRSILMPACHP